LGKRCKRIWRMLTSQAASMIASCAKIEYAAHREGQHKTSAAANKTEQTLANQRRWRVCSII
jgi:hypothetical protein